MMTLQLILDYLDESEEKFNICNSKQKDNLLIKRFTFMTNLLRRNTLDTTGYTSEQQGTTLPAIMYLRK